MGCAESKLDRLQAVGLCRDRSRHLTEAIRHRQSLADSHRAYLHLLRSLGPSLNRFFLPDSSSPLLPLPSQRKCDHDSSGGSIANSRFAPPSCQGSSDDDEGEEFPSFVYDDGFDGLLCTNLFRGSRCQPALETVATSTTRLDYARSGNPAVASVAYEPPPRPDVFPVQIGVYGGEYYCTYPDYYHGAVGNGVGQYTGPYQYPPAYGVTGGVGYVGSSSSSHFAVPPSTSPYSSRRFTPSPSCSSRFAAVPSLAPPATTSTWDFLNPVDSFSTSYQGYNRVYVPTWGSREAREREGITDLEEEVEDEQVIVKEMHGDRKFELPVGVASSTSAGFLVTAGDGRKNAGEMRQFHNGLSSAGGSMDYQMHGICIANGADEIQLQELWEEEHRSLRKKVVPISKSALDVMQEVKTQFDRASVSCKEVFKLLGSTTTQYTHGKHGAVPSRLIHGITPTLSKATTSQLSSSRSEEQSVCSSSGYLEFDEDRVRKNANLSSTLHKLCVWEKKLQQEVRAEEKLRMLHDKKCKLLRRLNEKGTEAQNLHSTRALVKKLSTKIRIAIQFIDSISNKLNRMRDEELWPHINELIHGLARMWHCMMECHKNQCQALIEAKNLDSTVSTYTGKLNDAHMEATIQLVWVLLEWIETFCSWIQAQRSYIKSLNGWLQKCLEPKENVEGVISSPGKLGAPPIFVVCDYWSHFIDRNSEKEVVEAMQAFVTNILHVWKQHYYERHQMVSMNRDMERTLKILDREDQKIQKSLNSIYKRHSQDLSQSDFLSTTEIIHLNHVTEANNLKLGLKRICVALEKFTSCMLKGYIKLCTHCDQSNEAVDHEHVL